MSAPAIIGIVLGALILLVILILLIPVGITVKIDKSGSAVLKLNVLFLSFQLVPAKEKKKKKKKKKEQDKPEEKEKPSLSGKIEKVKSTLDTIKEFSSLIRKAAIELKKLIKKTVITKMKINVTVSDCSDSANAALTYGAICAVTYPLLGWLHEEMRFRKRAEKVNIRCDFFDPKTTLDLNFKISVLVCHIVAAGIRVFLAYLKKDSNEEAE